MSRLIEVLAVLENSVQPNELKFRMNLREFSEGDSGYG